jgi:cystathionine beta-lyase/cystathionine gamma-synthase
MSETPIKQFQTLETNAVHAGEHGTEYAGSVTAPIFQSATYLYGGQGNYNDIKYIRLNNTPTHDMVSEKIAALEGAEAAMVTSSGMAAISTTLLTIFEEGGQLLTQNGLYGGTHQFLNHDFKAFGYRVSFLDLNNPAEWEKHLQPDTRAFYVETITNPLLDVVDLEAVVKFCRQHKLVSVIDNTMASPMNFNPLKLGFDIVVHSCTKYLNGHSDVVAGAFASSQNWVRQITRKLNHFGGCLDPHACFLLNRGIKTLAVRVKQQNTNALALAKFLEQHPKSKRVLYPGLESHQHHKRAARLLRGFGGMVSFEFAGTPAEADTFLSKLKLPKVAPSLGGVESLITRPATTSHSGLPRDERVRLGITDELIRISVGIEDTAELIADFKQAFEI